MGCWVIACMWVLAWVFEWSVSTVQKYSISISNKNEQKKWKNTQWYIYIYIYQKRKKEKKIMTLSVHFNWTGYGLVHGTRLAPGPGVWVPPLYVLCMTSYISARDSWSVSFNTSSKPVSRAWSPVRLRLFLKTFLSFLSFSLQRRLRTPFVSGIRITANPSRLTRLVGVVSFIITCIIRSYARGLSAKSIFMLWDSVVCTVRR